MSRPLLSYARTWDHGLIPGVLRPMGYAHTFMPPLAPLVLRIRARLESCRTEAHLSRALAAEAGIAAPPLYLSPRRPSYVSGHDFSRAVPTLISAGL